MRQAEVSQSVVPGPVESALPRHVLEMENLGPQLKPSGSATLELGTEQFTFFYKSSRSFWCILLFGKH